MRQWDLESAKKNTHPTSGEVEAVSNKVAFAHYLLVIAANYRVMSQPKIQVGGLGANGITWPRKLGTIWKAHATELALEYAGMPGHSVKKRGGSVEAGANIKLHLSS